VTAYTQTWSDVEARIGSLAKAGQIAGNFNTLIMLRVKEVATAELLTSQLPEVHVVSTVVSSSVSDTCQRRSKTGPLSCRVAEVKVTHPLCRSFASSLRRA
jgi:hypothetical protein